MLNSGCRFRRDNGICGLPLLSKQIVSNLEDKEDLDPMTQRGVEIARGYLQQPESISGLGPNGECGVPNWEQCSAGRKKL